MCASFASRLASSDFSKSVVSSLSKKGVTIQSVIATPAYDGDAYFSGTAYGLVWNEKFFIRNYSQILAMAKSSWIASNETI